jgi:hypothetical protein
MDRMEGEAQHMSDLLGDGFWLMGSKEGASGRQADLVAGMEMLGWWVA